MSQKWMFYEEEKKTLVLKEKILQYLKKIF